MTQLRSRRGFTLIELMVVMAIIATLLTLVAPRYYKSVDRSKEVTLKQNLTLIRDALDKHYGDTGTYPESLEALVEKRYLRKVPIDPVTDTSGTWILVPPKDSGKGAVFDVHSGADGTSSNGTPFGEL